ncbi:MAG: hypothetical protein ABIP75_12255 [Pyrinomonadaceae bacterium]
MKPAISIVLMALIGVGIIGGAAAGSAQAQGKDKTVWMVCGWDTSSIWTGTDGKQKFERRFYVSPLVSMTTEDYLSQDSKGGRLEGLCGDYLEQTVNKAATARGEKLEGGSLTIMRNIELSGEDAGGPNPYNYATKESIEKKRADTIKDWVDAGRVIYQFNWDPTGARLSRDLSNETNRKGPELNSSPSVPGKPVTKGKGARE